MRFYYEQDGDGTKNSLANRHYVVDSYADPLGEQRVTEIPRQDGVSGAAMAREGRELADRWNEQPPWPAWDTIQAERDGYQD